MLTLRFLEKMGIGNFMFGMEISKV